MNCVHCAAVFDFAVPFLDWASSTEVTGALIGAFAGAYAATRFAERKENISIQVARLDQANRCLSLAAAATLTAMNYKDQITNPVTKPFFDDRGRFLDFVANGSVGGFHYTVDNRDLPDISSSFDQLIEEIVSMSVASSLCVQAALTLRDSQLSMMHTLQGWKEACVKFEETRRGREVRQHPYFYFGCLLGDHLDSRIFDSISGIANMADNFVYFSELIYIEVLHEARKLDRFLGKKSQGVRVFQLADVRKNELFPSLESFSEWESIRRPQI